jgi:hypothetical protein
MQAFCSVPSLAQPHLVAIILYCFDVDIAGHVHQSEEEIVLPSEPTSELLARAMPRQNNQSLLKISATGFLCTCSSLPLMPLIDGVLVYLYRYRSS